MNIDEFRGNDTQRESGQLEPEQVDSAIAGLPVVPVQPALAAPICTKAMSGKEDGECIRPLPPIQQTAIEHLAAGRSVSEAARLAGIRRETLHRWLRDDPEFVAAFNAWRNEIRCVARTRLLTALGDAVDCVRQAIRAGDARLAYKLLCGMRMTGPIDPLVPADEDPRLVKKQMKTLARDRKEQLDAEWNWEREASPIVDVPRCR